MAATRPDSERRRLRRLLPLSSKALLALLPDALRAAVLTHFGQVPTASGVGPSDNAAETKGLGGAVSR